MTDHASDCAIHNMPALLLNHCDCGAMTDPADIDLKAVGEQLSKVTYAQRWHDVLSLIAAVEALRKQVAQDKKLKQGYYDEALKGWTKFHAAEAHVVELALALGELVKAVPYPSGNRLLYNYNSELKAAHTVLAATPTEALERAKAYESIERALSRLMKHFDPETGLICSTGLDAEIDWVNARDALIKLDTLYPTKQEPIS